MKKKKENPMEIFISIAFFGLPFFLAIVILSTNPKYTDLSHFIPDPIILMGVMIASIPLTLAVRTRREIDSIIYSGTITAILLLVGFVVWYAWLKLV